MGNVVNYIKWRGDLSFSDSPFNEVDNLALALLVYNDFFGIVPVRGAGIKISIKDAAEWYFTKHSIDECSRLDFDWILYYMAKTRRFGGLYLSDYVDLNESEKDMMFTAFTVHLPDGTKYVSFRGTTMDIDDWRLDFKISFEEIGAQKAAADYLKFITEKYSGDIFVGGHSKGGNLAVYSAMNAPDVVRNRIKRIYSNPVETLEIFLFFFPTSPYLYILSAT